MIFTAAASALLALASLVDAAPRGSLRVLATSQPTKANSYIVSLRSAEVVGSHMNWINRQVANTNTSWVGKTFNNTGDLLAYSVVLNPSDPAVSMEDGSVLTNKDGSPISILDAARARSDIEFIEADQIMKITATQANAPWGLQRISSGAALPAGSRANALAFTYEFNETAGQGIDVYVIDTGINTEHQSFEGRASFGFAADGQPEVDDQGHGTHCAGTIASKDFGVAKAANVIAVKVLGADGSGATSDIVSGIQFAMQSAAQSGKPSPKSAAAISGAGFFQNRLPSLFGVADTLGPQTDEQSSPSSSVEYLSESFGNEKPMLLADGFGAGFVSPYEERQLNPIEENALFLMLNSGENYNKKQAYKTEAVHHPSIISMDSIKAKPVDTEPTALSAAPRL